MSRNKAIILGVRILLFIVLGILFVLKGMEMEILPMQLLFVGIGMADFAYAWFLSKPFRMQRDETEEE